MEDMKGDMAGAACVVGLMHALATRKAKVNVIGAIGLVENMPDGKAQRPGDIVKTMSGQTIEIINTDAEGRLVLADALHYVNTRFEPKFIVDLATLTGAIMVSLGQEYAGLFSNDDKLSDRLTKAGQATGERVWRMPMGPEYDKQIDSKFADMKNTGGRFGGSITAAQLLLRFVGKTPWAHLDIAGTALGSPQTDINKSWSAGWGVRLLDQLVSDHYEVKSRRQWRGMTEVLFYHLDNQRIEAMLPALLEKSLARGWRVAVQSASRRSRRFARRASVDLSRRQFSAAWHRPGQCRGSAAGVADNFGRQPQSGRRPVPDRRCTTTGGYFRRILGSC